jgi:DNA-directed RNA polymerase specialized sigma24 family protein
MPEVRKDPYLTPAEVEARIEAVTAADCIRLEGIARIYADGTGWDPADLLQEAFVAALSRRRWRADLGLVVFLVGIMRSLAHSRRKGARLDPMGRSLTSQEESEAALEALADSREREPSELAAAEQEADQTLKRLMAWFKSDPEVLTVLRGRARGDSPAEIRADLRMNQTQYESVCRRMLRGYQSYQKAKV